MNRPADQGPKRPKNERLPYEPPAVIAEEVFETLALSCNRANQFECGGNIAS